MVKARIGAAPELGITADGLMRPFHSVRLDQSASTSALVARVVHKRLIWPKRAFGAQKSKRVGGNTALAHTDMEKCLFYENFYAKVGIAKARHNSQTIKKIAVWFAGAIMATLAANW
jgi:hypothetical protein